MASKKEEVVKRLVYIVRKGGQVESMFSGEWSRHDMDAAYINLLRDLKTFKNKQRLEMDQKRAEEEAKSTEEAEE